MLRLPENLDTDGFLARYWQKRPLFMPQALFPLRPSVTRNELAWLATLDDVESRIVFRDTGGTRDTYRVETGPFASAELQSLPRRNWTLLVHDVDKHLPAMRRLFDAAAFLPDWRIDDLMISFAAPGGGVGPHRDNYDVFLCQGIGVREWRYTLSEVPDDAGASRDLRLVEEFADGERESARQGDVLYLPPGIAHWGIAERACLTYSIGFRAPTGYTDADLGAEEVRPGYISRAALRRACGKPGDLGCAVTELKDWLRPELPDAPMVDALLRDPAVLRRLRLHGMARLAYDDERVYLNGNSRSIGADQIDCVARLCEQRRLNTATSVAFAPDLMAWLLAGGAFELPDPTRNM